MPIHLLEKTDNYQLGIWKMDEEEELLLKQSGSKVRPSHVNQVRRMEYLAVRAMASEMGIQGLDIAYRPSGKPYVLNSNLSISISHTKNYVAVMLSPNELIGVDLEYRSDRILKIRHKFMHPDEENRLKQVSNPMSETVALLLHWCAKEALFKAVPEEGVDFAQELRISDFSPLGINGRFRGTFLRTGSAFVIDYRVEPDFVLTCSFSTESK